MASKENPIIVALDGMEREEALSLAKKLSGKVWGFKVNDLLVECGRSIIEELKEFGKVFADPKYNDIPNTVDNSVTKLARSKPDFITVHASGGIEMMQRAVKVAGKSNILAVTVLTSLGDKQGYNSSRHIFGKPVRKKVLEFALDAGKAGVYGIVCSGQELEMFRDCLDLDMLKEHKALSKLEFVVPAIRPLWYREQFDDQERTTTPAQAIKNGAKYIVIGRPIVKAKDPLRAVEMTLDEINGA